MSDARRAGASLAACLVALAACTAPKPPSAFEEDYDAKLKPWEEMQTQLPTSRPKDADLIAFGVSGGTTYDFLVDESSLSIGTDGVFRYTLVAKSPAGIRNVSYEGIRCETRERKIYATGRDDGTWARARNADWKPIEEVGNNRQHAALMKEYFCPDGTATTTLPDIVARLKRRPPPSIL